MNCRLAAATMDVIGATSGEVLNIQSPDETLLFSKQGARQY
jgi:hypothetical protein